MLTDSESRVVGPLVVAFGAGFFAAGLARLIWPAADGMIYLASLGVGFGFPLLAAGLWSIRADMRRLDVDVADSTSNRKLTDAKAELMRADAAVRLAATQAPVAEPVGEPSDDAPDYTPAWRAAAHRFVTAGALYGFQVRVLAAGEHQVIEWDAWGDMVGLLLDAGVLVSRGGTRWAPDWSWARWQREYMTLPLPQMRVAPPEVLLTTNTSQKQRQQQAQQAGEGLSEGITE